MPDTVNVALSVDALAPRLTGIGRYCLELARGLPGSAGVGRVSFFRGSHWLPDPSALLAEQRRSEFSRLQRLINDRYQRWRARKAVVHGPNYFLPAWAESGVITVHDLSVMLYPETHPIERLREFERRFQHSLERATAILTDSEAVRGEVIAMLGVAAERVHAVPLGITPVGSGDPASDAMLMEFGLTANSYTLCVSTFEPRKRIDRLVAAYALLEPGLRRQFPLVLVGASGWLNEDLNVEIAIAQAAGWLIRLDYVSDQARDALYRGARLFVYPSRYEGFGLPPLEAMQHGVPTIVGDAAALIEMSKGAGRVVEVDDIEGFVRELADTLQNETWRREAGIAGRAVASGYTWSDCMARTISVYQQAQSA